MFSQHSFRLRSFLSVTSPSHSTMDRHERPVKRLRRDSFHIEHRGELNGRLIHPLIYYDTYRFKQIRKLTSSRGRQRTSQSHRSMNVPIQTGLGAHASSSYARTSLAKSLVNRHTIKNTRPTFTCGDSSKQKTLIAKELCHDPFSSMLMILDGDHWSPEFEADQFAPSTASLKMHCR
mgnify:CR=1 FL=1